MTMNEKTDAIPEGMELPTVKTVKGVIRKTLLDENGMSYEVEKELEMPDVDIKEE